MAARLALTLALLAALVAAFLLWPSETPSPTRSPVEKTERGPDMRPSEWAANQRLFPVWQAAPNAYRDALDQAHALRGASRGGGFGEWQQAGPTNVGGRISDIEYAPSDPDIVYASAATGGVYRSTDEGLTWSPIFDDRAVLTIGDLAVHPTDPNEIWVGTGEANGSHNNFAGGGLYRSSDAGQTWDFLGLGEAYSIARIRIDPTDTERVFVAAVGAYFGKNEQRGVYRTTDGGENWERTLFVSDSTAIIDLAMKPGDPNTLFAATWERIRRPTGSNLNGPTSGLWRSTDGGDSWEALTTGLPNPATSAVGRIGLATCASEPNTVYASYSDGQSYIGLFRSDDGGDSWYDFDDGQLGSGSGFEWYFGQVRCRPDDAEQVFVLGTPLWRYDGFWDQQFGFEVLHVDHHALAFKPGDPDVLLSGNDGGIDRSTDGGVTWSAVNGLPITQFYEIGLDVQNPQRLYGGTQDNSTNRTLTGDDDDWDVINGGDGFYTIVDPTNSSIVYTESQYGYFVKSTDTGNTFFDATNGINFGEPTGWSTPVVMDPNAPQTLYYGTNHVYRSTNGAGSWTKISPRLTRTPEQNRIDVVTTIGVSPVDSDIVWAGTADGQVWVTADGETWENVTQSNLPFRWIMRVIPDPVDANVAYLGFSGLKWYDPIVRIFRTDDLGQTWTSIAEGLPDAPVNAIAVDPVDTDIVYVGTDVGAFVSTARGEGWAALGTGLPAVPVYDLKVHPTERFLAAGTHGRSMWTLALTDITVANEDASTPPDFALDAAYPNPFAAQTTLRFTLDAPSDVRLEVFDVAGRRVATLAEGAYGAGTHRATWTGSGVANGVYLARLTAGDRQKTQRLTLAR